MHPTLLHLDKRSDPLLGCHKGTISFLNNPSHGVSLGTKFVNPFARKAIYRGVVDISPLALRWPVQSRKQHSPMEIWESPTLGLRSTWYLPKIQSLCIGMTFSHVFMLKLTKFFRAVDSRDIEEGDDDGASALSAYFESVLVSPLSALTMNRVRMPDGTSLTSKHNERFLRLYVMAEAARTRRVNRVTPRWYPYLHWTL